MFVRRSVALYTLQVVFAHLPVLFACVLQGTLYSSTFTFNYNPHSASVSTMVSRNSRRFFEVGVLYELKALFILALI